MFLWFVALNRVCGGEREVLVDELGVRLRVPAHFDYVYEENRFHTYSGPEGTVKIYLSARCCQSPADAARAAIARARSGRHPRSYHFISQGPIVTASGLGGVRGVFGLRGPGGRLAPFVDKHFLPIPGGGVCCVSVVSRFDSRRTALGAMVLRSFRHTVAR